MKLVRTVVFTCSLVLLGLGYAASQQAFFQDPSAYAEYTAQIDVPIVKVSAFVLLIACILMPFLGKPEKVADQ